MSDIFLSYTMADKVKATKLAAAFKRERWSVWDLLAYLEQPAEALEKETEGAKVVIALWSRKASESLWVRQSLKYAKPGRLVVVLLDKVELPIEISPHATIDFSDWDGETEGPVWNLGVPELLSRIRSAINTSSPSATSRTALGDLYDFFNPQKDGAVLPPEDDKRFRGVFISYRRDEAAAYAGRLYDRLAARFGREKVFLDVENVGWGEDFLEAITAAAESCEVMIVLVSRQWARGPGAQAGADDYVRLEVATALGRKVRMIPILIQGAALPAAKELPEDLSPLLRRNALALSDARWERDVEDLIKSLEGLLKN